MPWSTEHKRATHERILSAAASAFRERGVGEVGVGEIMSRAGLTHGGFYAHFKSKDALVAEAITCAWDDSRASLASLQAQSSPTLLGRVDAYLSPEHLAHPEKGCPIAALGPELARGSPRVRQAFASEVRKRLNQLAALPNPRLSSEARSRRAAGALACMVGGLIVARNLKPAERAAFLEDCRAFMHDAMSDEAAPDPKGARAKQ